MRRVPAAYERTLESADLDARQQDLRVAGQLRQPRRGLEAELWQPTQAMVQPSVDAAAHPALARQGAAAAALEAFVARPPV